MLSASCYFYISFIPIYIFILGFTIVIDYFAGIYIQKSQNNKKKFFLILSLVANIGVLVIFKYYNFLNDNLSLILNSFGYLNHCKSLSILLPIGLSFHTFQAMSYTIEVYRGNQVAERNFGIYSLYVMFYPQLVAGPIERPQNLIHQFYEKHDFEYTRVVDGLKLILWGLFMKLVIADRLAIFVDAVYNNSELHGGKTLLLATIFFSFQIYCDFAGYSNIALGTAKIMGFNLMTNFKRPYFSESISEFWTRWHVSLSTWFKDYLYISLGGNRVSIPRWYVNLFVVFLLSGLWHGANWTFIFWGAINGFYLVFANLTMNSRKKFTRFIGFKKLPILNSVTQIIITFILTSLAWVFFRSNNISQGFLILKKIFTFNGKLFYDSPAMMIYCFLGILILLLTEFTEETQLFTQSFFNSPKWHVRSFTFLSLIIIILLVGVFDGRQFIYFQF